MKIQNDAIQALLAQDEAHRKTQTGKAGLGGAGGFDALLSGQIQRTDAAAAAAGSPLGASSTGEQSAAEQAAALAMLMQSTGTLGRTQGTGNELDLDAEATTRIDDLLGQWESYTAALNGGGDLRSVYEMLQDMTSGVKDLKASMPGFLESNSALGSLVNELDVLSTTENIKFNRGDYL